MGFTYIQSEGSSLRPAKSSGAVIQTYDEGQKKTLEDLGAMVQATNIKATDLVAQAQPATKTIGGSAVSGYQDTAGNFYIVDEQSTTNIVTQNPLGRRDRVFNQPSSGGPIIDGGGIRPTPTPPGPITGGSGGMLGSGRIFTKFAYDDVIPNQQETVTRALWSNNVGNLITFHTSSAQTATQQGYYYEIYNSASTACGAEAQFSIAWGHKFGSGSLDSGGQVNDTPSRAIYSQYKQLCLDPGTERFIVNGTAIDHIYAINVNRARMREWLDEGNFEVNIHNLSGSEFEAGGGARNSHTGSNVTLGTAGRVLRLIDDSTINSATNTTAGEVYQLVSGSIEDGVYNSSAPHIYGLLYRRLGVAIIDGALLDQSSSFLTVTGSEIPGDNAYKLFTAMSGAALYTDISGDYKGFAGRSSEKVKSTHYFVRVKNGEYNFSNNPTFTSGSEGDFSQPSFINDPKTYITTVGLYNSRQELLAVAKLSQPLQKTFTKEALIKVKLDFVFVMGMFSLLGSLFF